jgi:xylulose-5-phosphate/fructose-6-phosphate phosphoketolase
VAGKTATEAINHCEQGIRMWESASSDRGEEPDVVMACAGDVLTLETLPAVDLLRQHIPDLKVRVVDVVDLTTLQPKERHLHGLTDSDFNVLSQTTRRSSWPITAIPGSSTG